jgi:hypothetical protein
VANYAIVTQYPDVEVVGNTQTRDVQVIGVVTQPNQIYFEVRVPRKQATTSYLKYTAQSYRDIYELIAAEPAVADVTWRQEPTLSGQLQDWITIYVTSTSGDSTTVIDIPFSKLGDTYSSEKIAAMRKALDATEAS